MNVPFLDLSWQEAHIQEERERRFAKVIASSSYVFGSELEEFEAAFASYTGASYAIGVSGGTHALSMIYRALGIGPGDEVITIPTTFIASVTGLIYAGARPVFVDIDPKTRNFDFSQLEAAITPRTKAILPVHLYGLVADMDRVQALADAHELTVVEDACQAHGATYKGRPAGSMSAAAAFSFYPGKNLGAYGDGGAVVTSDERIASMVRALRNQGCIEKYDHEYLGYNGRLDTLQAAVLSSKLVHLPQWNEMRRGIADRYLTELAGLPLVLPAPLPDTEPVWHLFVVQVPDGEREQFMRHLTDVGVASGIHYPTPLHRTTALSGLGYGDSSFPEAERLAGSCVSLPLYPGMSDDQVAHVIGTVHSYFHG